MTQHLSQVLDIALQIDRSHDNSLAASAALDQQNQVSHQAHPHHLGQTNVTKQIAYTLARNAETARALHYQTEILLEAIFTVTENVTDAAKTVSEFHNDIHNLPTKVVQQVFEASLGGLPFGWTSVMILSVFWCLSFAALDTWGPFRARGSIVASLGIAIGMFHLECHSDGSLTSRSIYISCTCNPSDRRRSRNQCFGHHCDYSRCSFSLQAVVQPTEDTRRVEASGQHCSRPQALSLVSHTSSDTGPLSP